MEKILIIVALICCLFELGIAIQILWHFYKGGK